MTGERVEVRGDVMLRATLARADAELEHLDDATASAAQTVAERGRIRAPKLSGRLAGSVRASHTGTEAIASSGLIYAPVIHDGWAGHNIAANPFLRTAAEDSEQVILPAYRKALNRVLSKVKGV